MGRIEGMLQTLGNTENIGTSAYNNTNENQKLGNATTHDPTVVVAIAVDKSGYSFANNNGKPEK